MQQKEAGVGVIARSQRARGKERGVATCAPWLLVKELRSRGEILDYFRVRHTVYVETGYIPQPRPQGLDIDCFDPHSRFLGAFDLRKPGCPLIGGARMILARGEPNRDVVERLAEIHGFAIGPRPHVFLVQNAFELDWLLEFSAAAGRTMVEFGRTVCLAEHRSTGVGAALVHGIHGLGLQHGVDHAVAIGPPSLRRYYMNFGCRHLESLGVGRVGKYNAELECLVLDLPSLLGACRSAHQAASQLRRYDRILICPHKRCLEWHNHHPKFQPAAFLEDPVPSRSTSDRQSALQWRLNRLPEGFQLHDATLGDGLQSPSVRTPSLPEKVEILRAAAQAGMESAHLGLPGAGARFLAESARLLAAVLEFKLPLAPTLAGRTCLEDVNAIVEAGQRAGLAPEAGLFVGSSRIRQLCDKWDLEDLTRATAAAVARATACGLEVMFVAEDTTRAHPDTLRQLFLAAIDNGARRLCLCDTVGHATPAGVRRVVQFARSIIEPSGARVKLDWQGHQDRGLSLANSLAAVEAGVHRVHGTALGVGERVGMTPLEQLVMALHLRGVREFSPEALRNYLELVAKATRRSLPFRTDQSLQRLEEALPGGAR